MRVCAAPGAIRRAGMAGAVVGVDYALASHLAPPEADEAAFMELLLVAEQGMLAGIAKQGSN